MKNIIPPNVKIFIAGLATGLALGCLAFIGLLIFLPNPSSKSQSTDAAPLGITQIPHITATNSSIPISSPTLTSTATYAPTLTPIPTTTNTTAPTFTFALTSTSTPTETSLPPILSIPYTACGDHMAYSANAEVKEFPIVENDKIIEYASYVLVTYKIKNTYDLTPIYGFEVHPSPGYDNPDLYPEESPTFNSDPLIQPSEVVTLKSVHLFMPAGWSYQEHPKAFLKLPENLYPEPYKRIVGGNTVTFKDS
ncbi:MAG: hypothetical protein HY865_10390 [Chloroflexi bacterium]|nr:hypothetical protein [Chloroflexota bacterium]